MSILTGQHFGAGSRALGLRLCASSDGAALHTNGLQRISIFAAIGRLATASAIGHEKPTMTAIIQRIDIRTTFAFLAHVDERAATISPRFALVSIDSP
jgi:hypothetical protein